MRALVIVCVVLAAGTSAPANSSTPSRTLDQKLVRATAIEGCAREVSATAHHGTGRRSAAWARPAFAEITSGQTGSAFTLLDNALAWVTAGAPTRDAIVIEAPVAGYPYPMRTWGTLASNARLCRPTAKKVPLTTSGLRGGAAGVFDDEVDCLSARRVLVRVHATLRTPASPTQYRQFRRVTAPVAEAQVVVRTEAGKPLAYAEVSDSGKAGLFTAPSCVPD
jgi:hypothetical protein